MRSYGHYCSAAKALDVVGDRWTLLVVRELLLQDGLRYADLLRNLPGISTNLLVGRLRSLEDAGLLYREDAPPPVSTTLYRLTDTGRELDPVIRSLVRFGARYMADFVADDVFRGHWLAYPISELIEDADPSAAAAVIEVRADERPTFIELADNGIRTTMVPPHMDPALIMIGDGRLVLGVLTGQLDVESATELGLDVDGDRELLRRLRFNGPHAVPTAIDEGEP